VEGGKDVKAPRVPRVFSPLPSPCSDDVDHALSYFMLPLIVIDPSLIYLQWRQGDVIDKFGMMTPTRCLAKELMSQIQLDQGMEGVRGAWGARAPPPHPSQPKKSNLNIMNDICLDRENDIGPCSKL
jgi:hypothetical protein